MSITITIAADTADAAREEMRKLIGTTDIEVSWTKVEPNDAEQPPVDNDHVAEVEANAPKRERGKPAPGKSRRTKAEIAEDEAAAQANISADPENRVDPAQVDDPETEAQDAADEKAEVEATAKELTREDVKGAMTAYVKKYGMEATQEDGPKIFLEALGKPPSGEDYWKLSLLPDDQDALAKVIDTWNKATELNPLKRGVVGA